MNTIILIPARLASTRLPNKPMADINGVPMIVHVWKRAVASNIGPVVVACDNERIRKAITREGGHVVMTREDHPSGSDRIYEALTLMDAVKKFDVVVNVQGDVPTIDPGIIRAVLEPLRNPSVDIGTLACEIHTDKERKDPSVVKPIVEGSWSKMVIPVAHARSFTRETPAKDAPCYHHIGIYAYRRAALERFVKLPPSPLELRDKLEQMRAIEAGMRIDLALVKTAPLGVDTQEHLEEARRILRG